MAIAIKIGNLVKQSASSSHSIFQAIRCMPPSKLFSGGLSYATGQHSLREEVAFYTRRGMGASRGVSCDPGKFDIKLLSRRMSTVGHLEGSDGCLDPSDNVQPLRVKVKRLDKTAKHIMNILEKEAVDKVQAERDIPDVQPGCIIELKVEAPENKGRVSTIKGLVIARKNAGLGTTIRVRRLEANIGIESVFPLYSPNIKEIKVLEKRSVRRAKLYYIRDRPFNIALRELAQRTAKKKEMALRGKRVEQSKK